MRAVSLYYDLTEPVERVPAPGEVLTAVRKRDGTWGTSYLIEDVREVRARAPRPFARFHLRCRRTETPRWPARPDWLMWRYPRGRPEV